MHRDKAAQLVGTAEHGDAMQRATVFRRIVVHQADHVQRVPRIVKQLPQETLTRASRTDDEGGTAAPGAPAQRLFLYPAQQRALPAAGPAERLFANPAGQKARSEEHTSELQSLAYLVCRLLLEKK